MVRDLPWGQQSQPSSSLRQRGSLRWKAWKAYVSMSLARTRFRFGCFDPAGSDRRPPVTCGALLKDLVDVDAMGKRLEFGARAPPLPSGLRGIEHLLRRDVGQEGLSSRLRSLSTSRRARSVGRLANYCADVMTLARSRKVRTGRKSAHI
jgi:hypothetical protein